MKNGKILIPALCFVTGVPLVSLAGCNQETKPEYTICVSHDGGVSSYLVAQKEVGKDIIIFCDFIDVEFAVSKEDTTVGFDAVKYDQGEIKDNKIIITKKDTGTTETYISVNIKTYAREYKTIRTIYDDHIDSCSITKRFGHNIKIRCNFKESIYCINDSNVDVQVDGRLYEKGRIDGSRDITIVKDDSGTPDTSISVTIPTTQVSFDSIEIEAEDEYTGKVGSKGEIASIKVIGITSSVHEVDITPFATITVLQGGDVVTYDQYEHKFKWLDNLATSEHNIQFKAEYDGLEPVTHTFKLKILPRKETISIEGLTDQNFGSDYDTGGRWDVNAGYYYPNKPERLDISDDNVNFKMVSVTHSDGRAYKYFAIDYIYRSESDTPHINYSFSLKPEFGGYSMYIRFNGSYTIESRTITSSNQIDVIWDDYGK